MIKFSCPHCEQHISTEPSSAGLAACCPTCGGEIVVPSAEASPAEPADFPISDGLVSGQPDPGIGFPGRANQTPEPEIAAAGPSVSDRFKTGAKAGWASVKRNSKIAALHAHIEKLRSVDLRKAHHALGKRCYELGLLTDQLANSFEAIREVEERIAADRQSEEAPDDEKKSAALKRLTKNAAKATHAQALNLKLQHLLTDLGRQVYSHNEQGNLSGVEGEIEAIGVIEGQIRQKENELESIGGKPAKAGRSKVIVATVTLSLVAIGSIYGLRLMGKSPLDYVVSPSAGERTDRRQPGMSPFAESISHSFWRFRFGSSKSECAKTMKALKNDGVFAELDTSTVVMGWLPGAETIDGTTSRGHEISMDGILSIPANELELYFCNDSLAAINIRSYFRTPAPPNAAERQAQDMEKYFGVKAELRQNEDTVGNKSRYYHLRKGSLIISIKDDPKPECAPDIRIYNELAIPKSER